MRNSEKSSMVSPELVLEGDGGDHRIGQADVLPGTFQVAGNPPRQLGGGAIKDDNL